MPLGTVQTILVCGDEIINSPQAIYNAPSPKSIVCPNGYSVIFKDAYVIDQSQANRFDAAFEPFDYSYASGLWTLSFSMVVGLYVVSRKVGALLGFVRHG